MTDNDIIKALECCVSSTGSEACDGCPLNTKDGCETHSYLLEELALDLIKRQKAEIEEQDQAIVNALKRMGQIRAEAITEFAERLCEDRVSNDPVVIAVKTELKMMKGEQ